MNSRYPPVELLVWGDFACFTRPEMKVERMTYAVPTPSAARGLLEAIFWKPEFTWRITEIVVLKPVRYVSILRNEVNSRQSDRSAADWKKNGGGFLASDDRAQRHTVALRDVAYIFRAQAEVKPGVDEDAAKFRDQFHRRVRQGRCFHRPYLGCREFSAFFAPHQGAEQPLDWSDDLGSMLFDLEYAPDASGSASPRFFRPRIERGVIHVPPWPTAEAHHAAPATL